MLETIKYLAEFGGTVLAVGILGLIMYRQQINFSKERLAADARLEKIIKADQDTRENHTRALVNMYTKVDDLTDFNVINKKMCVEKMKECDDIREAMIAEVSKLQTLNETLEESN